MIRSGANRVIVLSTHSGPADSGMASRAGAESSFVQAVGSAPQRRRSSVSPDSTTILNKMLKQNPTLDRVFHALADPTRRSIVERLSRGSASVSELAVPLPMSLPGVLQHLQVLEESGLVRSEKIGRVRTCRIEIAAVQPAERWIEQRRAEWVRRLDRLGEYLAEENHH
jgi:DNA-binding transcriptional ArsR family regulator